MNRQHAPWRIALGTFALTRAVLVSGLAASPVQAKSDHEVAVDKANALIDECIRNKGDPEVTVEDGYGWVDVDCLYEDHQEYCFYYYDPPSTSCGEIWISNQPVGLWDQIGTTDDIVLLVEDLEPSPVTITPAALADKPTPAAAQRSVTASADDQDEDRNTSKGKKSKKGKKVGNGRKK